MPPSKRRPPEPAHASVEPGPRPPAAPAPRAAARRPRATGPRALVLHVAVRDITPPIWRRVRVPDRYTLHQLHRVFQLLFGWLDYHLYEFAVGGRRFTNRDPALALDLDLDADSDDTRTTTLRALGVRAGTRLVYTYDFGDDWQHDVVVEAVQPGGTGADDTVPTLLDGARAGPPEDAGGVMGYARVVAALADPADPEHAEYRRWAGATYVPDRFDPWLADRMLGLVAAWGGL